MRHATIIMAAAGLLGAAACGDRAVTGSRNAPGGGPSTAEAACITAVERNSGGRGAVSVASEPADGGQWITARSPDGSTWRCRTGEGGAVADLSMIG